MPLQEGRGSPAKRGTICTFDLVGGTLPGRMKRTAFRDKDRAHDFPRSTNS